MPNDSGPPFGPIELDLAVLDVVSRIHHLVQTARRHPDLPAEAGVNLTLDEYEHLLELASGSSDLVARSNLTTGDSERECRDALETFRNKVLEDLGAREDLDYDTMCEVLTNLKERSDWYEPFAPPTVGKALVRAWIRSGGDLTTNGHWHDGVSWSAVPEGEGRQVLDAAVDTCVLAAQMNDELRHGLRFWVETVAPEVIGDAAERLEWMAVRVARRSNEGMLHASREFLREATWDWYGEVEPNDVAGAVRALRALETIARSNVDPSGEMYEGLPEAWENFPWADAPVEALDAVMAEAVAMAVGDAAKGKGHGDELVRWVGVVAPKRFPDLAERLLWFAASVGKLAGDAPPFSSSLNETLTELVCDWLQELEKGSIEDIAVVLRSFRRTPMAACLWKQSLEESLDALAEALKSGDGD